MNQNLGIWQGGTLNLNQAKPARKRLNLNKLSNGRGLNSADVRRSQRPNFGFIYL